MPISTKVVSSYLVHGDVYSIKYYVIKLVSDLRQVGGFLRILPVSSTHKTDTHDIAEMLLNVALNTKTLTLLEACGQMLITLTSLISLTSRPVKASNLVEEAFTHSRHIFWLVLCHSWSFLFVYWYGLSSWTFIQSHIPIVALVTYCFVQLS